MQIAQWIFDGIVVIHLINHQIDQYRRRREARRKAIASLRFDGPAFIRAAKGK